MRLTLSHTPVCEYSFQAAYFGKNAGFMPVVHTAGLLMIFGYTMEYSHLGKTHPCIVMITVRHNHLRLRRLLSSRSVALNSERECCVAGVV